MAVLIVLLTSWLLFHLIGAAGVSAFATGHDFARFALAIMFLFTSTAHFNQMKQDLARLVPAKFPRPMVIIYVTGVLEILGAIGLMLPQFHRVAAFCLTALLIAMFPRQREGGPPTPHAAWTANHRPLVARCDADSVYLPTLVDGRLKLVVLIRSVNCLFRVSAPGAVVSLLSLSPLERPVS